MATEKRLTEKHYNSKGYYMKCSGLCHFDGHCANCDELVKIVDRLGEYEDKAKQTVDAVEVVHGRWENNHCNVCGMTPIGEELWKHLDCEPPRFELCMDYCPNCGAKMDGDGNG